MKKIWVILNVPMPIKSPHQHVHRNFIGRVRRTEKYRRCVIRCKDEDE